MFQEITPLETLEQALEILDYEAFRKEQAAALAEGRYLGVGICSYVEPTSMGGNTLATEAATVKVDTSGRVMAYLGTTSHGQSIETTMAQIVAEHLGVAYEDVTIVQADSQSTPYGPGTGGSRTAVVAGGATRRGDRRRARQGAGGRRAHDGSLRPTTSRSPRAWCRCGARRRSRSR